ncbi:glycosyltransferase family 2 protein [Ahrensia sp. R2A130]|uniref:glycosyltransferase family 2 protein n=1 Tax=Ahrensia sp. R2A130 TaxID=744979 RepID=UPI0001E094B3|nr:glycosyltransferase family 2 protein [Ahrensia sp. R2A130]EFL88154.1 cellulose synthase catalytic subunit [UDP-forming] [Ahrensia sp. R2A130]
MQTREHIPLPDMMRPGLELPAERPRQYLEHALTGRQRVKYGALFALWLGCATFFWNWWLTPEHNIGGVRFAAVSLGMGWIYFLQFYFLAMFMQAKTSRSDPQFESVPRVAMVVTKTPTEPFSIVRSTLLAMLAQDHPHDTWLADENPTEDTLRWCHDNDVRVSTRHGCTDYHRAAWPRRTRCKEGNLAFFYDRYGYENYDIVAQLDADHVPQPGYLAAMVAPFADPLVGYVSAPSVCSSNETESWSARARLHSEALFHGVLQSGYTGRWAPMCIGSHYAVRTQALQHIGGLGPELAEDHSTTMMMNAGGWRGVHAINASAIGAGPSSFADMVTQEFQWSRSLLTLLMSYTPRSFTALPGKLKFQFVFSQLWYPLFALFMATMYLMPIAALGFGIRFANVTYPAFLGHLLPTTVVLVLAAYQMRRDGLFRPLDAKVISWEKMLFPCAQWPWVLWGCLMAVADRITGRFVDFRITPKGTGEVDLLPLRVVLPYAVLAVGSLLPVLLFHDVREARGFYLLATVNALLYTALFAVILFKHWHENDIGWSTTPLHQIGQTSLAAGLVAMSVSAISQRGLDGLDALSKGLEPLVLTQTKFLASGAGRSPAGTVRIYFQPRWEKEADR